MKKLNDYVDEILRKNHTDEEWKLIGKQVEVLCKSATDEEIKEFENSGAGNTLGMILEYM